jgi:hypothetical protein
MSGLQIKNTVFNYENISVISHVLNTPNFTCLLVNGLEFNFDIRLYLSVLSKMPDYFHRIPEFNSCFVNLKHITHCISHNNHNNMHFLNGRVLRWTSPEDIRHTLVENLDKLHTSINALEDFIDVSNLKYREIEGESVLHKTLSILNDENQL